MCYETVFTMLTTYGNWYYADEDPLAKRRKTSKADSSKTKEENIESIDRNDMTCYNKPFVAVRNLIGDRLSVPKYPSGNSIQGGDVFTNVGRGTNNPYYIQGYAGMPHPSLMFGVRNVPDVWAGRVQIPNEPPRYEYRQSTIARPYPLRIRPVFNSFPIQLTHTGWVRASVSSAFTPVRHTSPENQTSIVTTQAVVTTHPSSIQSLTQMVCSVTAATSTSSTEALSAKSAFTSSGIVSSESSQSRAAKSTTQANTTASSSSIQQQEPPKFQSSHIPVETITYSSSLQAASQSACSVTTTVTISSAEDLSVKNTVSSPQIISPGSSTSQTSVVTNQPIMTAQSPPIQSPGSVIDSFTSSTTALLPEDLSVKGASSASRIMSSGSSQSQTSIVTNQPIMTAQSPPIQSSGSAIDSFTSTTTLLPEDLSVKSVFSAPRIISPGTSQSQTSVVTNQPIMAAQSPPIQSPGSMNSSFMSSSTTLLPEDLSVKSASGSSQSQDSKFTAQPITTSPPSSIQVQEPPKFQPSHIPVQTIMYSPSLRAAKQSFCSVTTTTTTTTTVTISSDEGNTGENAFNGTSIISSGSSISQTSGITTQPITNTQSSIQAQEPSNHTQPSHIPVKTIMFSPSLRAANQSFHSVTTNTTTTVTTSSAEEFCANSTSSTAWNVSSESSKSQAFESTAQSITTAPLSSIQTQEPPKLQLSHIPVQTIMYSPSLRPKSRTACPVTTTSTVATLSSDEDSVNSAYSTDRIISPGSSTSQTSVVTNQSIMAAQPSPIQSPGSMITSFTSSTTTLLPVDLSVNSTFSAPRIMSSGSSQTQTFAITSQSVLAAQSSSIQSPGSVIDSFTPYTTTLLPEDLSVKSAFSSPRIVSPGSSSSQTSVVTNRSIMTAQPSPIQSPGLMIDSFTPYTTTLLPEDLSVKSSFSSPRPMSSGSSQSQDSKLTVQTITISPPSSVQPMELSKAQPSEVTCEIDLTLSPSPFQPEESSKPQTPISTTQSITTVPLSSVQSTVSSNSQTSELTSHLLLLSPSPSLQSSEASNPETATQPITNAPSSSLQPSESAKTQASKIASHLLSSSSPQPLQSPEPTQSQNAPLLTSPPISNLVCTTTTPTTTSSTVVSSSFEGERLSEAGLDIEEAIIQSVVDKDKDNLPGTSKASTRRIEDEIEEKDALLQRMYSVPAFGGKTFKGPEIFERMLTKSKLCHLFKCMAFDCSFTCNQKTVFDHHIKMHEAQLENEEETSRIYTEEDYELFAWKQCAYCCESPIYPTTSLSEHLITEHGYCVYQCAYCFYRALFQNYVDIHQTLAHRKILRNHPRMIYRCKAFSEGPTLANALKKIGRRRCVRPYICDQCGSEFLITEEFMNHLLKEHQSVTTYTCHICKNVCFKPDRLVVHYKLHAYSTYQCAYCLHGTETERKMIFHLCTFHSAQPACLYVRAWYEGKQVQSEDKSKRVKNKTKCSNQLECLKMISYDIEAIAGESTLEEASDEDSGDEDRLVIDESQELNDIIAELGIITETDLSARAPLMENLTSIGNSTAQNVSMSALLPNAKFSLEGETETETVLISSGSSSNSSSI